MQQPPAPPAQPSPSRPPADPVLQQRAWAAAMMASISLFGIAGSGGDIRRGVYVIAIAVIIAATGVWLAVTALRRARLIGSSRPRGAIFAAVLGVLGIGFGGMVLAGCALFWPQLTQYSKCEAGAGTLTAQRACYGQLRTVLERPYSSVRSAQGSTKIR